MDGPATSGISGIHSEISVKKVRVRYNQRIDSAYAPSSSNAICPFTPDYSYRSGLLQYCQTV